MYFTLYSSALVQALSCYPFVMSTHNRIGAIRRLSFALLLAASRGAAGEWTLLGENGDLTLYVDPATIVRADGMAKLSALYDHKSARSTMRGWLYRSERMQTEFDCKRERWRAVYSTYHFGNMASGPVFGDSRSWEWVPIAPETVAEKALRMACGPK